MPMTSSLAVHPCQFIISIVPRVLWDFAATGAAIGNFFKADRRRSVRGTRTAPEAEDRRFSGKLAYPNFNRPTLRTMIHPADTNALSDAAALLSAASNQLAEALD